MNTKLQFFWIPAYGGGQEQDLLNQFLGQHRVIQLEKHFCQDPSGWAISVEWTEGEVAPAEAARAGAPKIDYREVLDPETFQIYAALRLWRKERGLQLGVPVYNIATNQQLAAIAEQRITTRSALQELPGFGLAFGN